MSENEVRQLVHDAARDRLEAAFLELLKTARVMEESEAATLRWLRKQLGGKQ